MFGNYIMTPEGKVKDTVKKLLKSHGAYYHMPVQNGMGSPTLDFICCHQGRYFAVETKAAGKKLTERQESTKAQIEASGGKVFVVSDAESLYELQVWLENSGFKMSSDIHGLDN